ncbi:kinase-like protein, partial [Lichtheimia hyalospora FSU 10163]
QLGNCIGKGQFGAVYRALDMQTGEVIAIKRIKLEDVGVDHEIMASQEVDLLKDMESPNIVRYLGSVRDDTYLNILLEYVENGSLLSSLKAFGSLPEKLVASYTYQILGGLSYLHKHAVVHCDLKAANILTTKTGDVKLTDFGVSLNLRVKQDDMGAPAGTPNWMAPEVIELQGASTKSDIWSLGCTIIEMLTGKPPYAGMFAMSTLYHIVEDEHPPIPDGISESLLDLLLACFRKDPLERPTAEELMCHPWVSNTMISRSSPSPPPVKIQSTYHQQDDDIDISLIFEYMRTNPAMNMQRSPSPYQKKETPREHSFVKTSFGKGKVVDGISLDGNYSINS